MLGFGAIGQYALGEIAADDVGLVVVAEAGNFAWTGVDVAIRAARSLSAGPGAVAYTGHDASLVAARIPLSPEAGAFTWTGHEASVLHGSRIDAGPAAFNFNGVGVAGGRAYIIACAAGSYTWSAPVSDTIRVRRVLRMRQGGGERIKIMAGKQC